MYQHIVKLPYSMKKSRKKSIVIPVYKGGQADDPGN